MHCSLWMHHCGRRARVALRPIQELCVAFSENSKSDSDGHILPSPIASVPSNNKLRSKIQQTTQSNSTFFKVTNKSKQTSQQYFKTKRIKTKILIFYSGATNESNVTVKNRKGLAPKETRAIFY